MSTDDSQLETAPQGDVRELWLARRQKEVFENVRGFAYLFFGLQAYPLLLVSLQAVFPVPELLVAAFALCAIVVVFGSAIVALFAIEIALRNAPVLEWWMIAVGALPWMVIATEGTIVLCLMTLG